MTQVLLKRGDAPGSTQSISESPAGHRRGSFSPSGVNNICHVRRHFPEKIRYIRGMEKKSRLKQKVEAAVRRGLGVLAWSLDKGLLPALSEAEGRRVPDSLVAEIANARLAGSGASVTADGGLFTVYAGGLAMPVRIRRGREGRLPSLGSSSSIVSKAFSRLEARLLGTRGGKDGEAGTRLSSRGGDARRPGSPSPSTVRPVRAAFRKEKGGGGLLAILVEETAPDGTELVVTDGGELDRMDPVELARRYVKANGVDEARMAAVTERTLGRRVILARKWTPARRREGSLATIERSPAPDGMWTVTYRSPRGETFLEAVLPPSPLLDKAFKSRGPSAVATVRRMITEASSNQGTQMSTGNGSQNVGQ